MLILKFRTSSTLFRVSFAVFCSSIDTQLTRQAPPGTVQYTKIICIAHWDAYQWESNHIVSIFWYESLTVFDNSKNLKKERKKKKHFFYVFPSPLLNGINSEGIKPAIKGIHVNPTITSTRLCNVDNFKVRSYFSAGSVYCKIMGRSCLLLKRYRRSG